MKALRLYNRPLSDAEIAQNYEVDVARFDGQLTVTNVVVVASGGVQAETGAYKVEGEWTFTATTATNVRGETLPVTRYVIQTLENGEWTNKQTCPGNTYTYVEGTSPATVCLTWKCRPDGFVLVLR
jgi:hypothetical protein